jgi:hypothetical protein
MGVFRFSTLLASVQRLRSGLSCLITESISEWGIAAGKDSFPIQLSNTSIRALVKECRPGPGVQVSKPQAAIVSITPCPLSGAAPAAAQQSSRNSTSHAHSSNTLWIADHFTVGDEGLRLLSEVNKCHSINARYLPQPSRLPRIVYQSMSTIIDNYQIVTAIIAFHKINYYAHELSMYRL